MQAYYVSFNGSDAPVRYTSDVLLAAAEVAERLSLEDPHYNGYVVREASGRKVVVFVEGEPLPEDDYRSR